MATYKQIIEATARAWNTFENTLVTELGDDFDKEHFWNISDSGICKVDDYVMQSTNFAVDCPNCQITLDNEDQIIDDECCEHCKNLEED